MIWKVAGIVICEITVYIFLKKYQPEYAVFSQIAFCALLVFTVKGELSQSMEVFSSLFEQSGISASFMSSLLKILGITLVTQFSADMCRDAGQSAAASKVEFAGKVIIIAAALPVMKSITELLLGIVNE